MFCPSIEQFSNSTRNGAVADYDTPSVPNCLPLLDTVHFACNMFMIILFEKDLHHFFLLNERFKFGVNF